MRGKGTVIDKTKVALRGELTMRRESLGGCSSWRKGAKSQNGKKNSCHGFDLIGECAWAKRRHLSIAAWPVINTTWGLRNPTSAIERSSIGLDLLFLLVKI